MLNLFLLLLAFLLSLFSAPVVAPEPTDPAAGTDLFVSEIAPDNEGYDNFEFFEITNPAGTDVNLSAEGITLSYIYADDDDRTRDVPFEVPAGTVIPADSSVAFWLQYATSTVDSTAFTIDDFRQRYGVGADVAVVRVGGQPGMANGGDRGVRVSDDDGTALAWSYYPSGSVAAEKSANFARPAAEAPTVSAPLFTGSATPTPGSVEPGQLVPTAPEPEPTPTPTAPTPTPTAPTPTLDPDLTAASLQITEVLPDSTNVGSADGFEFIELYNATDKPIDFGDYTLNYLYPTSELSIASSTLWPTTPSDPTIQPGGTLVAWVKNGANDDLTAADFNAQFGSSLTAGQDLVEINQPGMANGSLRGINVETNTGHVISTAFYNVDGDDTTADQGIQYGLPDDPAVPRRTLLGLEPASPGAVTANQVPAGLVAVADDSSKPTIRDTSDTSVAGTDIDVPLVFTIADDTQVKTVTLQLVNNVEGAAPVKLLRFGAANQYRYTIPAVDLLGKDWFSYTVTASDGTNTTTYGPIRVEIAGEDAESLRLNLTDGQPVAGSQRVAATFDAPEGEEPTSPQLAIDGAPVSATLPSLESEPVFAFEASATNTFFRNGVLIGDDVLTVFDDGIPSGYQTITAKVPLDAITSSEPTTLSIYAGTKAAPEVDENENNDDFTVKNLRLVLPDGRVLRSPEFADAEQVIQMGDSTGKNDFIDAGFTIPADAFGSRAYRWDTTAVADGNHTVTATAGTRSIERTVLVDNTAPVISSSVVDAKTYRGEFTLDASATDAGAGVDAVTATLDGEPIELPLATSSVALSPGEHTVEITARDRIANSSTKAITFSVADETPSVDLRGPADGAEVDAGTDVELTARVDSPEGDDLDVRFLKGSRLTPGDGITAYSGSVNDSLSVDRADKTALSEADLAKLATRDGNGVESASADELPYEMFTVDVPEDAGADASVRLSWSGSANAEAKVLMYALNDSGTPVWDEVDRHTTTGGAATDFELGATVPVATYGTSGTVTVLVQHSQGWAGPRQSTRESAVTPFAPDATPRSAYDFTVGWESDTQYYNANPDYYPRQLDIHRFLLDQRANLDLQYLMHTGDIVDDASEAAQWERADAAYRLLDEADLPYGVLAGNHDVGQKDEDFSAYQQWFGADRYAANPWYGGTYQNNRGHYDLFSAGGIDFMVLSMSWNPSDAEIAWMNQTIRAFPERKVIINVHEFILTTGGLGPGPQRILDEVVAPNPNVMIVGSGHYHDAFTRIDAFGDDGDGVAERKVYGMLFDYQGLPEGGQGFLRLLHFDNVGQAMTVRTYSPSLDQFNSEDPTLDLEHQEFTLSYADLGITPRAKSLTTDAFAAEVLTTSEIGAVADVASPGTATVTWESPESGQHGWYVEARGPFGGVTSSPVRTFTVGESAALESTPAPVVAGDPVVGSALRATVEPWGPADPKVDLAWQWLRDGEAIEGATGAEYTLTAEDLGASITVAVTGSQAGYEPATVASDPVGPVVEVVESAPTAEATGTHRSTHGG